MTCHSKPRKKEDKGFTACRDNMQGNLPSACHWQHARQLAGNLLATCQIGDTSVQQETDRYHRGGRTAGSTYYGLREHLASGTSLVLCPRSGKGLTEQDWSVSEEGIGGRGGAPKS